MGEEQHLSREETQANVDPISEAQREIDQALQDAHATRLIVDGEEKIPPQHEGAVERLRQALQTVPDGVRTVSITGRFPRLFSPEDRLSYAGYLGSSLLVLQELLDRINSTSVKGENVPFELVVRPNQYPDELRRLHFGSRARELELDVKETMRLAYEWGLHFLDIKPYGPSPADYSFINAKPFRVPLQIIQGIKLNRDPKPLTSYLEGRNRESLQIVPIE